MKKKPVVHLDPSDGRPDRTVCCLVQDTQELLPLSKANEAKLDKAVKRIVAKWRADLRRCSVKSFSKRTKLELLRGGMPTKQQVSASLLMTKSPVLCFRCEYRARALESGSGPRYECTYLSKGGKPQGVSSCYLYRPVSPLVLSRTPGDLRSPFGPAMCCARSCAVSVAQVKYRIKTTGKRLWVLYAVPVSG